MKPLNGHSQNNPNLYNIAIDIRLDQQSASYSSYVCGMIDEFVAKCNDVHIVSKVCIIMQTT